MRRSVCEGKARRYSGLSRLIADQLDDRLVYFARLGGPSQIRRARAAAAQQVGDGSMNHTRSRIELQVLEHHRRRQDRRQWIGNSPCR